MVSSNFLRVPILTRKASSPPCTAGSQGYEFYNSPHSRSAEPARSPLSAAARFTHLGHGPMRLSLSLLHAQRAISRSLSFLAFPGTLVLRRNGSRRAAVGRLGLSKVRP